MPYKDPHSERAKRSVSERCKRWREKHKEAIKEYKQTSEVYYKGYIIYNWKRIGIIDTDYDLLFEVYKKETNCWICGKEFIKRLDKHLDHDHDTGEARYVCCCSCNCQVVK